MLLKRFLLDLERVHVGLTLAAGTDIESSAEQAPASLVSDLVVVHNRHLADFDAEWREYSAVLGLTRNRWVLSYVDLLEINALAAELYARCVIGRLPTNHAWTEIRRSQPQQRAAVLSAFAPSLAAHELEALHALILSCLCSTQPVLAFIDRLDSGVPPSAQAPSLSGFSDQLREAFDSMKVELLAFPALEQAPNFVHVGQIYKAAQTCVAFVRRFGFDLGAQIAERAQLPIPPTCFYPPDDAARAPATDRILPFVRKADLRSYYGDVFTISSLRLADRRTTVASGLLPTAGCAPCVPLAAAHSTLAFSYLCQSVLGERVSYSAELDRACAEAGASFGFSPAGITS
jgi:hypothetical protein